MFRDTTDGPMIHIEKINALAELERYALPYEPAGEEEVRCKCPVHEDNKPSLSLNVAKNLFICHAAECKATGDIITLLAFHMKCERKVVLADMLQRYPDLEAVKVIRQDIVEEYHAAVWGAGPLLKELYKRGLKEEDIRNHKLGFHEGRIIIPIYDVAGRVINLRKYLPGAPGPEKFRNVKGYDSTVLYPIDQLKYPTIWICGGEMKAIVVARLLNKHNIGAITVTAGEGNWENKFTPLFKGKHVFICMDIDAGGRVAAKTIGGYICHVAESTHIIELPLDKDRYPKGDVNDYVGQELAADTELLGCMTSSYKYVPPTASKEDEKTPPTDCKLIDAAKAVNVGRRLQWDAIVVALDEVPFLVPKEVDVSCKRDDTTKCVMCPVYAMEPNEDTGRTLVKIPSTSHGLLELLNCSKSNWDAVMPYALGCPKCKSAEYYVRSHYNIYDSRLSAPLSIHGDNKENTIQPAYLVSERVLDMNLPYRMVGRPFPHPKTSQAVLIADEIYEKEDNLTSLKFTEDDLISLKVFQPEQWTVSGLSIRLADIVGDFTHNVTRIFFRDDLHIAADLAFHSVLYFQLDGRVQNGWVNCLITGDSSQGKSEVTTRLIEHYCLGTRHDCKNASEAGLLGGLQQLGTRWFVSWGVIPIHDKQLVVMEEIKGANEQVLGRLTDMRSSGFAEITKIERRKAHARTRLVMISNPRGDRPVSAYNYGIEIIRELMGSLEDIRRFDFAIILAESEVKASDINRVVVDHEKGAPKYGSDISKKLVLWSWTRRPEEVIFTPESKQLCLKKSIELCNEFTETMPLCDKGTTRYKLARLSAALACRTFSTDDGKSVIVRPCHVEFITEFLRRNYSLPHFGYKDFTEAERYTKEVKDPDSVRKRIEGTKFPRDLVEQMLRSENIVLADICDWCEVPRDVGQNILSFFVRRRALFRNNNSYDKSPGFITLLKDILANGKLEDKRDDTTEF